MYRRIYYDGSKIYLWETAPDGKNVKHVFNHEIEYYIPDKTKGSPIKDIFGNPVIRQTTKSRAALNELLSSGIQCCESDIHESIKFLQKRYAHTELKADIDLFKIGILDIETESEIEFSDGKEAKYPINLITLRILKTGKTYTFGLRPYTGNSETVQQYQHFDNETELLNAFVDFFRHCSFDIITGWNVLDFDIRYIINRLKFNNIAKTLSPIDSVYEDREGNITIGGLAVLDYQTMYKEFLKIPMSSYALNFVCLHEIQEGKLELEGAVNQAYKTNWNEFVEYNINDTVLVHKLDNKRKLLNLCITLSYQTLIPFEKALSTIPMVEGYLLKLLHKNNMVMNNRTNNEREEYKGGYVFATPGFYEDVLSFDVESMYPHLIMMFNISPETLILNPDTTDGLIRSPVEGVFYRKDKVGILPQAVKSVFTERKKFKDMMNILKLIKKEITDPQIIADKLKLKVADVVKKIEMIGKEKETVSYYDAQQYVRKILANSMYGVLGNPYFHFFDINNAKAITIGGQTLIKHLSNGINNHFKNKYEINYDSIVVVDTDSCYIHMRPLLDKLKIKMTDNNEKIKYFLEYINSELSPVINKTLNEYAEKYNVDQIINFKHEKIITKHAVFVKKHYIIEMIYEEGVTYDIPKMKYTGVQTVRSDTPEFCRGKLESLIDMIFKTMDMKKSNARILKYKEEFYKEKINRIASTKGLNKFNDYVLPASEYVANGIDYPKHCPIQIKAAIAYNFLIERDKLPLMPSGKGVKIKFIYVNERNIAQTNVIGFIGKWPEQFNKYFKIDYETQFEKTFMPLIEDLYKLLKWEDVQYEENILDDILS